jgi:hypothetical protein
MRRQRSARRSIGRARPPSARVLELVAVLQFLVHREAERARIPGPEFSREMCLVLEGCRSHLRGIERLTQQFAARLFPRVADLRGTNRFFAGCARFRCCRRFFLQRRRHQRPFRRRHVFFCFGEILARQITLRQRAAQTELLFVGKVGKTQGAGEFLQRREVQKRVDQFRDLFGLGVRLIFRRRTESAERGGLFLLRQRHSCFSQSS